MRFKFMTETAGIEALFAGFRGHMQSSGVHFARQRTGQLAVHLSRSS